MIKLIIFLSFVFFDLFSKLLIKNNFNLNQSIEINGYLDLVYVQNYGVSFGILSGTVSHWFLILIGLMIVLLLIYLIITSKKY